MKKHLFVSLALAGLFALSAVRAAAQAPVPSATLTENFAANPLQNGWNMFGDTNLFHWNPTNQDLEVTWDSTQPNSYFYRPLGTVLAMEDDFSVEFDLRLDDIADTGFEIAVGLNHFSDATNTLFLRGGTNDYFPNFAEFDYFSAYVSLDATLSDTNSQLSFYYDNLPLNNGTTYHIILTHAGGQPFLAGTILTNGQVYSTLPIPYVGPVNDFRLDTLSVSSYNDAGQDPDYAGSVLAHGVVANFVVTLPPPPVQNLSGCLTNSLWAATFICRSNWLYSLERSPDLQKWTTVNPDNDGNGATLMLVDPTPPAARAFYRIRAERP